MRTPIIVATVVSTSLVCQALGCVVADGEAESTDLMGMGENEASTGCDFGAATVYPNKTYTVSIANKNTKNDKSYAVDVTLAGTQKSAFGRVQESGRMSVAVSPWQAGAGKISVFETKLKNGVQQKKLAAECTFVVQSSPGTGGSGGGSTGGSGGSGSTCGDAPGQFCQGQSCDVLNRNGMCMLCADGSFVPSSRANMRVTPTKTCNDLMLEMADPSNASKPGSSQCRALQNQYHRVCCDVSVPPCQIQPQYSYPKVQPGNDPWCNLCSDGSFPGKPRTFVASQLQDVNGHTCGVQIWWAFA